MEYVVNYRQECPDLDLMAKSKFKTKSTMLLLRDNDALENLQKVNTGSRLSSVKFRTDVVQVKKSGFVKNG